MRQEQPIEVYTKDEAAAVLKVSARTVQRFIERGQLKKCSATRRVLIPRQSIDLFLAETVS